MEFEEVEVREPLIVNRETRDLSGNESEQWEYEEVRGKQREIEQINLKTIDYQI